jgi:hypothetical protein
VTAASTAIDIKHKVRRRARLALLLRESAARAFRWIAIGFGTLIIIAGAVLTPLPWAWLMIVLRIWACRCWSSA